MHWYKNIPYSRSTSPEYHIILEHIPTNVIIPYWVVYLVIMPYKLQINNMFWHFKATLFDKTRRCPPSSRPIYRYDAAPISLKPYQQYNRLWIKYWRCTSLCIGHQKSKADYKWMHHHRRILCWNMVCFIHLRSSLDLFW